MTGFPDSSLTLSQPSFKLKVALCSLPRALFQPHLSPIQCAHKAYTYLCHSSNLKYNNNKLKRNPLPLDHSGLQGLLLLLGLSRYCSPCLEGLLAHLHMGCSLQPLVALVLAFPDHPRHSPLPHLPSPAIFSHST